MRQRQNAQKADGKTVSRGRTAACCSLFLMMTKHCRGAARQKKKLLQKSFTVLEKSWRNSGSSTRAHLSIYTSVDGNAFCRFHCIARQAGTARPCHHETGVYPSAYVRANRAATVVQPVSARRSETRVLVAPFLVSREGGHSPNTKATPAALSPDVRFLQKPTTGISIEFFELHCLQAWLPHLFRTFYRPSTTRRYLTECLTSPGLCTRWKAKGSYEAHSR